VFERFEGSPPELAETTRRIPGLGAVGLVVYEDSSGDVAALCRPVRCRQTPQTFEIHGANDWLELVERYPLDVTGQRRAAWTSATGLDGRWLLPDWTLVAGDYDTVHLSVSGYLAVSGRALPMGDEAATFLAGWNPDCSYWLADALELSGPATEWLATELHPSRGWQVAEDAS
jgi:hypothetical protein